MRIDILTLFPEMCESVVNESIIGRAIKAGKIEVNCHNIRDYSTDKHRRVDDSPYGGGMGMLMQPQPIYDCHSAICSQIGAKPLTIYMSPKGEVLNQGRAIALSKEENICIICGHYEGVDQRLIDEIVDVEISIGDYVLTGGEMAALVLVDAVGRLCDGVLSDSVCFTEESHYSSLLEYPHYTRPPQWRGREVPEILLSGHHANIEKWRREKSIELTYKRRPDMLSNAVLGKEDIIFIKSLRNSDDEVENDR